MPNIAFISPDPELSRLAENVIQKNNFNNVKIDNAVLEIAVELAKEYEKAGVDVIVSRGTTGSLIKDAVNIPVILISVTNYDIMKAFYSAKKLGNKIAFFDHIKRKGTFDFESVKNMLEIKELQLFYYSNLNELDSLVRQVAKEGLEVVVSTGQCIINMAKKVGMSGVLLKSNSEVVYSALQNAFEIVQLLHKDRQIVEVFRAISNDNSYGVVIFDDNQVITYINTFAEKSLGVTTVDVIGKKIEDLNINDEIKQLFREDRTSKDIIHTIKNKNIILNRTPLTVNDKKFGYAVTFQGITKILNLEGKVRKELHTKGLIAKYSFNDIIGESSLLQKSILRAKSYSQTNSTVVITGESGTGKELFAHSMHKQSDRKNEAFVAINCATLPENLLESELFGYEEGSFTGAVKGGKPGLFELAHKGTIFLDEITELPNGLQNSLLRVLQERVVRRIGGHRVIPVDVRVIVATNYGLEKAVADQKFREDLFFRLSVLTLHVPPLRDRIEDLPLLFDYFFKMHSNNNAKIIENIPKLLINVLKDYNWPGNVRELQNFVERFVILAEEGKDNLTLLEELSTAYTKNSISYCNKVTVDVGPLETMQKEIIRYLIEETSLTRDDIAKKLGISRTTLWKKFN